MSAPACLNYIVQHYSLLIYRADVVQTAAGHEVAGWSVSTGHHPGGPQWDRVYLVSGVTVLYYTILYCTVWYCTVLYYTVL